jgi:hypothetical protein
VERARCVRMLTSLTRALRDLQALARQAPLPGRAPQDENYDEIPEDIDALRRELSARLNAMVAGTRRDETQD